MSVPYVAITNADDIITATVSHSHSSQVSNASFECVSHSLTMGDYVDIDMGYVGDHQVVFRGYVKQIARNVPSDTYTINLQDKLVRAVDYFMVSNSAESPFSYSNILAEDLVGVALNMAGLTNYTADTTYFTLGISSPVEFNLVSSYDFANQISNIVTYTFWYDSELDTVVFRNRKPYPVLDGYPELLQPGVSIDTSNGYLISTENDLLNVSYTVTERDLRNKIVVYGANDVTSIRSEVSPYLPDGFYKTAIFAAPSLIGDQEMADLAADYNLLLLNRLGYTTSCTIPGNSNIKVRECINVQVPLVGLDTEELWYIYGLTHSISTGGFYTELELKR